MKTPAPRLGIIPGGAGLLIPKIQWVGCSMRGRGGALLAVGVSEIHAYPLRPKRFEEPLFPTVSSKQAIIEHLLKAPWLSRASELEERTGQSAHALEEPIELRESQGRVQIIRLRKGRRCSRRREQVVKVLDRWRQVDSWWDEGRYVDRRVFRVLLSGGAVVDVAQDRSSEWFLVGVVD